LVEPIPSYYGFKNRYSKSYPWFYKHPEWMIKYGIIDPYCLKSRII
jgi:hypothetical protein